MWLTLHRLLQRLSIAQPVAAPWALVIVASWLFYSANQIKGLMDEQRRKRSQGLLIGVMVHGELILLTRTHQRTSPCCRLDRSDYAPATHICMPSGSGGCTELRSWDSLHHTGSLNRVCDSKLSRLGSQCTGICGNNNLEGPGKAAKMA